MKEFLQKRFADSTPLRKFAALLRDDSIESKYSVLPDFTHGTLPHLFPLPHREPTTSERIQLFMREALQLARVACEQTLEKAALKPEQITHIITISCTGMSAPGLEIQLLQRLGLHTHIQRHAVNFMGCYAAFHGFRLADLICKTDPQARVLLVSVELCTLHFRLDGSDDNILSTYLFGDGAAACICSAEKPKGTTCMSPLGFTSVLLPKGAQDMAWHIGNNGFEMVLNREVPKHIQLGMGEAYHRMLLQHQLTTQEISGYAIHPGGKSILAAFEIGLGIEREQLKNSYEVLKQFGNMSSVTIFFVLKKCLTPATSGIWYAAAFGPGLSVESALWDISSL
jgi:predicted naringenin-chalcone synthase